MQIWHRISIGRDDVSLIESLQSVEVALEGKDPLCFDISESDPRWNTVARLLREHSEYAYRHDQAWTVFTEQERDAAKFLAIGTCWMRGYPEPSDIVAVSGTRRLPFFLSAYDISAQCQICGAGARQKAPFLSVETGGFLERHDANGNKTAEADALNHRTTYPDANYTETTCDFRGKPLTVLDHGGGSRAMCTTWRSS